VKAILLAGGLGTRLREETEFRPKPMVEIGGRPILWHIMKHLSRHGISEFIIAAGYKSQVIKEYFLNYEARNSDFTVQLGRSNSIEFHDNHDETNWKVTIADTGPETLTAGRILKAAKYLGEEPFLVVYGDGIADVDITSLIDFHVKRNEIATVTIVQPPSRFGALDLDEGGIVRRFREKPTLDSWVNIGFFIFDKEVLDYLDFESPLEQGPLLRLVEDNALNAFEHRGFWQPMDTYREVQILNELWDSGAPPWSA